MRFTPLSCAAAATAAFALGLALAGCSRESAAPVAAAPSASPAPPATAAPATPAAPAAPNTFKFATQTLTVPAGFTVELVAGPPLVNRPISIAFDEQGRLYATDSSGFSGKAAEQFEQKPHRIVRLEDVDGDGRYDRSTAFAENVMFPQGALFYEGSLYVGAPPHIWKFTDADGDGVAEKREAWYDGKTLTGCANDLHGPYLGPEGWFYWTKGAFAEQQHTLPNGRTMVSRAAHIFRARPDGSGEEPVLTGGMDNPVGVAFTRTGDRILSGTFFQIGVAGKRDGLIHAIYGGVYGKDQPAISGHVRTGDLMPIMTHMGAAAPCGSTTYRSGAFGADYLGNAFVCYFNLRKISRHQLAPDGATYRTTDTDFVTSDSQDFKPTDVLEDADGSLLIADTGAWYKICCPTSQIAKPDVLGGIYRIRKTGAPAVADPRGLTIAWASASPAELAKLLGDARPYVVERAQHLLGKAGAPAVDAIVATALKSSSPTTRRNALWALARIETEPSRAAIRSALADADESVAQVAAQAVSVLRDRAAVDPLLALLESKNLALVRLAAEALGRIGDARAAAPILGAASRLAGTAVTATGTPADAAERILEHALTYALIELGSRDALRAQLKPGANARVLRIALVALDQMEKGGLQPADVIAFLDSTEPRLKHTAGWIVANRTDWGGALADYFRGKLAAKNLAAADAQGLQTQLAAQARSPAIQELLATTANDASAPLATRTLALRAMAAAALKETPARWFNDLAALLGAEQPDPALARESVTTARALPLPKDGHAAFAAALGRAGRNASLPADVRVDALAITPAAVKSLEPALFEFLRARLDPQEPMLVRNAAATVLARAPLTSEQRLALADTMRTVGALEAPKLLPAFEKGADEALGLKLIAALQQSNAKAGLRPNALRAVFAKYPAPVRERGDTLLAELNADAARQNAHVDALLAELKNGDVRRGQAVFNSEKTSCSACHVIGYLGGRLGPDLTGIGKIRNERELLEAIVYPSATLVRGFETFIVTTKNGETHGGIMKKDAADEVILATGPQSEQRIARGDIKEIVPGTISPMPPGLDAVLTKQELADLIAFLKSRQ